METNEIPTPVGRQIRLLKFHAADEHLDHLKRAKANGHPVGRGEITRAITARTEAENALRMKGVDA